MLMKSKANIILSAFFVGGLWSCGAPSKKTAAVPKAGSATAEEEEEELATPDESDADVIGTGTNSTPRPANAAQKAIIKGMTLKADYYNNSLGKIYTGYDGTNKFKIIVNIEVYGQPAAGVTLSGEEMFELMRTDEYKNLVNPEIAKLSVDFDPAYFSIRVVGDYTGGRLYELTTLKTGTAIIKGKWGATELSPLNATIAAYTAEAVAAGKQRYNTAVTGQTPSPSCASCHQSANGVDHSPFWMAMFTDAAVLSTIKAGLNTDDNSNTSISHKMTFSNAAEEQGIVAYLRALDPYKKP